MGYFYLYDNDNNVHSEGQCPDGMETLQVHSDLNLGLGPVPDTMNYVSETIPNSILRKQAYPSIGDQLDMLWHAMNDGTLPKVTGFYDPIKTIKDNIPK
jgi:hypothetical protein